jgi:hypothetical protein
VAHHNTWQGEAGVDGKRSPLPWDEFEKQLLLAQDGLRQQQIDQENQAFLAGIAVELAGERGSSRAMQADRGVRAGATV